MNNQDSSINNHSQKAKEITQIFLKELHQRKKLETLGKIHNLRFSVIDNNGELLHCSENSPEIIGYSKEDFNFLATFGYIHPDERNQVIVNYHTIQKDGFSHPIIYRIFTPKGEMKWIRGIAKSLIDPTTKKVVGKTIFEFDMTAEISRLSNLNKDNESFFKSIIDLINTPFVFLKNNIILWVNKAWEKSFGYSFNAVKNQQLDFLFQEQKDYANFLLEINEKRRLNQQIYLKVKLKTKDGIKLKRTLSVIPKSKDNLSQGLLILIIDIEGLSKHLGIENEDLHFLRSIFDNYDGVIIQIKKNRIKYVNKTIERMLLYTPQELIGQDLDVFFNTKEAYKKFLARVRNEFAKNKNFNDEVLLYRRDHRPTPFTARISPVSFDKTEDYLIALNPISDLKELVNELRREKSELENYNDLLFHNIKNLCQDALSQLEITLMQLESKPQIAQERLNKAKNVILQINELTLNMEKYLKLTKRGFDLKRYDLYKAITEGQQKLNQKYQPRSFKIIHNIKPKKYLTKGNELIDELFYNIFEKAIIYNNQKEVVLEVGIVDSPNLDDSWDISIEINDPKLNKELRSFFETEVESEGEFKGSDFNLNLMTTIIESFDGKINYQALEESQKGVLIISLPKYLL